jgi:hypothetical protein
MHGVTELPRKRHYRLNFDASVLEVSGIRYWYAQR